MMAMIWRYVVAAVLAWGSAEMTSAQVPDIVPAVEPRTEPVVEPDGPGGATVIPPFQGYSFDAADFLADGAASPIHGLNAYTVEAWVYLTAYSSGQYTILGLDANNSVYSLHVNTDSTIRIRPLGGAYATLTAPFPSKVAGKWIYIVATHAAGGAATVRGWVNGAQWGTSTASSAYTPTATPTAGTVYRIGANGTATPGTYWNGRIAMVRVWNRVLPDAEIATAMYNAWYTATGLIASYPTVTSSQTIPNAAGESYSMTRGATTGASTDDPLPIVYTSITAGGPQ